MNKALLIFLMLILPWQAFASMERQFAHVLHGGPDQLALVIQHIAEHETHIPHHHGKDDDGGDGDIHVDNSAQSIHHLADYEQGLYSNALLPMPMIATVCAVARIAPQVAPRTFTSHTTTPPTRPPCLSA